MRVAASAASARTTNAGGSSTPARPRRAARACPASRPPTTTNQMPFGDSSLEQRRQPDQPDQTHQNAQTPPSTWATMQLLETLGLKLVAGRDFTAGRHRRLRTTRQADQATVQPPSIITKALADKLFPGEQRRRQDVLQLAATIASARGRRRRAPAGARTSERRPSAAEYSQHLPGAHAYDDRRQLPDLRAEPGQRDEVDEGRRSARSARSARPHHPRPAARSKRCAASCYRDDRAMAWMLVAVMRRAAGRHRAAASSAWPASGCSSAASRSACAARSARAAVDILRYFHDRELPDHHASASSLGVLLAFGLNQLLMSKLRAAAPAAGATCRSARCVLWLLGLIAGVRPGAARRRGAAGGRHAHRVGLSPAATAHRRPRRIAGHASAMPTVLVIDDNPAVATRARRAVLAARHRARCARDVAGRRAWRCSTREPIDLVDPGHELHAPTPPRARKAWRCSARSASAIPTCR